MARCLVRVPDTAAPALERAALGAARTLLAPVRPPVATIAHHHPGLARLTCTCRGLFKLVDVDDPAVRDWLLAEHLRLAHPGADHLLVEDERTGVWSSLVATAEPEAALVLAAGAR